MDWYSGELASVPFETGTELPSGVLAYPLAMGVDGAWGDWYDERIALAKS
jgi:hypothetical protein